MAYYDELHVYTCILDMKPQLGLFFFFVFFFEQLVNTTLYCGAQMLVGLCSWATPWHTGMLPDLSMHLSSRAL